MFSFMEKGYFGIRRLLSFEQSDDALADNCHFSAIGETAFRLFLMR